MSGRLGAAGQAIVVVAAFAVSGAAAGVVWELLWDAPDGVVFRDRWFLAPAGPDVAFSGTGWYVVVALAAGALTAFAVEWWWPRHEIATVAACLVGSLLAGWVMFVVGHALGPQDPQVLAVGREDRTPLQSDLVLAGAGEGPRLFRFDSSALAAFPIGAMTASIYVLLAVTGRRGGRRAREVETHPSG